MEPCDWCAGAVEQATRPLTPSLQARRGNWRGRSTGECQATRHLQYPTSAPRLLLERCRSATSCAQVGETGRLLLLYEQSDETQVVMNPDRFVFIEL